VCDGVDDYGLLLAVDAAYRAPVILPNSDDIISAL